MWQHTFDGRKVRISEMSQQHLSNAYWYALMRHTQERILTVYLKQIDIRFKSEILPYHPKVCFLHEIQFLERHGYLQDKEIWYDSKKIGEIDDEIINDITDLEK